MTTCNIKTKLKRDTGILLLNTLTRMSPGALDAHLLSYSRLDTMLIKVLGLIWRPSFSSYRFSLNLSLWDLHKRPIKSYPDEFWNRSWAQERSGLHSTVLCGAMVTVSVAETENNTLTLSEHRWPVRPVRCTASPPWGKSSENRW